MIFTKMPFLDVLRLSMFICKESDLTWPFIWLLKDHTVFGLVFLVNDFLDNSGKIYVHLCLEKNASNE